MKSPPTNRVRFTPGTFLAGLIVLELLALLFSPLRWFAAFNHRAWTPLLAVEIALVGLVVLALWAMVARLRRGTFQFSLRALVLLTACIAIPLAALTAEMRWARDLSARRRYLRERKAEAFTGGTFRAPSPANYYYEPQWLAGPLGVNLFPPPETTFTCLQTTGEIVARWRDYPEVEILSLRSDELPDEAWRELRRFPHLRKLGVRSTPLSDALIEAICAQRQLLHVDLVGSELTDQQLARLAALPHLKELLVSGTAVTGRAFLSWPANDTLVTLGLVRARPDAAGLAALGRLRKLESLWLTGCELDDETLGALPPCPALLSLDLQSTKITDAGLRHLAKQPNLVRLNLFDTAVTDACVETLCSLPRLEVVNLEVTSVTADACRRLVESPQGPTQVNSMTGVFKRGEQAP